MVALVLRRKKPKTIQEIEIRAPNPLTDLSIPNDKIPKIINNISM